MYNFPLVIRASGAKRSLVSATNRLKYFFGGGKISVTGNRIFFEKRLPATIFFDDYHGTYQRTLFGSHRRNTNQGQS